MKNVPSPVIAGRRKKLRYRTFSWKWRITGVLVAIVQMLATTPCWLAMSAVAASDAPSSNPGQPALAPAATPAPVKVNKHAPGPNPTSHPLSFKFPVSDEQIIQSHAMEEVLVPIGGKTSKAENEILANALLDHARNRDNVSGLERFVASYPKSAWNAAVLTNLGIIYRKTGYYSKALDAWKKAWALAQNETQYPKTIVADRAVAGLAHLLGSVGRKEELEPLLQGLQNRKMHGTSATEVMNARFALAIMKKKPGIAFKCGPFALGRIQRFLHPDQPMSPLVRKAKSSTKGFSLSQVQDLATQMNMGFQAAKRGPGAPLVLPAVVHWKAGHYAAIVKKVGDSYLVQDPTFGRDILLKQDAIDAEASGYYLIPQGNLPAGWVTVSDSEAQTVWGRGVNTPRQASETNGGDLGSCHAPGMASYRILMLLACLRIDDTPLWYHPPVGPDVAFSVAYNQYEMSQTGTFTTSNLGADWIHPWQSYVNASSVGSVATVVIRGGGYETYSTYTPTPGSSSLGHYETQVQLQTTLYVVPSVNGNPVAYERIFPDGSMEIFDTPADSNQDVYLWKCVDPQGNALTFTYSPTLPGQLISVTDAIGQATTLSYGLAGDSLKITAVTDHFGRTAKFGYTLSGGEYQLTSITDVVGIVSQFTYGSGTNADAIVSMTTPYGTTTFQASEGADIASEGNNDLVVTDPNGAKERAFARYADDIDTPQEVLPNTAPENFAYAGGIEGDGDNSLEEVNTYYWDKKAMMDGAGDLTKAHVYHWLADENATEAVGVLFCEKAPLESRVWYNYNRVSGTPQWAEGTSDRPTGVARLLDDGTTQYSKYQYNVNGLMTQSIDPLGRKMIYTYDPTNNIDLTMVQNGNGDALEQISYADAPQPHLPTSIVDASGQQTQLFYTALGQIQTVTDALGETTTFNYDGTSHYLTSIVGPTGASTTFTYDGYGRIQTVMDSEGYTVAYAYDALNRPTVITYPDGTFEQMVYNILDVGWQRDRLGRWTSFYHDAVRNLVAVEDPLGRLTRYGYCSCGALVSLVDPAGNATGWTRDIQKRPTAKIYADGTKTLYSYDLAGRLTSTTDAKGQVKHYTYLADNALGRVDYLQTAAPMPSVSFTYDANYNRVTGRNDGTGATTYAYNPYSQTSPPAVTTGAGRLLSETGPLAALGYTYDPLGRVLNRSIGGGANTETVVYDPLGRITTDANQLGSFTYTYVDATARLSGVTYPNGQSTSYSYFPNVATQGPGDGDQRLRTIQNFTPGNTNLSRFDYTYDPVGNIATWTRQTDTNDPTAYAFEQDAADQLTGAVLQDTTTSTVLHSHYYGYDLGSNRTSKQWDNHLSSASYNSVNQMQSEQGGGPLRFSGTLNEPASVTVGGNPATVTTTAAGTSFSGSVNVTTGSNNVVVSATDTSGQTNSHTYQVNVAPATAAQTFTYDLSGNMTSDGTRTFGWDAENRLVSIAIAGSTEQFVYNGVGQRVAELMQGSLTRQWVWDGTTLREERDASGNVTKRYYAQGMQQLSINSQPSTLDLYYTRDHLGSIREMVDGIGALRARYDYDAWGWRTKISGDLDADFGFTGHYWDSFAGVNLTCYRAYDPNLGRWLSRDPIEENGGINPYGYCDYDPINRIDPDGRFPVALAAAFGANLVKNIAIGAGTGFASGAVADLAQRFFSTSPPSLRDTFANILASTVAGTVGGVGSSFGPIGAGVGGVAAGYCQVHISDALGSYHLSPKNLSKKTQIAMTTGGVLGFISGLEPSGTTASFLIPVSTTAAGLFTDKLIETLDAQEKVNAQENQ